MRSTRVVDFVGTDEPQFAGELMQLKTKDEPESGGGGGGFKHRDDLYEPAVDIVIREGRGSVSLLQRALGIGYGRAARLIDFMAEDGIVGEYNGSQAREVLITLEDWEAMSRGEAASADATCRLLPRPDNRGRDTWRLAAGTLAAVAGGAAMVNNALTAASKSTSPPLGAIESCRSRKCRATWRMSRRKRNTIRFHSTLMPTRMRGKKSTSPRTNGKMTKGPTVTRLPRQTRTPTTLKKMNSRKMNPR